MRKALDEAIARLSKQTRGQFFGIPIDQLSDEIEADVCPHCGEEI